MKDFLKKTVGWGMNTFMFDITLHINPFDWKAAWEPDWRYNNVEAQLGPIRINVAW